MTGLARAPRRWRVPARRRTVPGRHPARRAGPAAGGRRAHRGRPGPARPGRGQRRRGAPARGRGGGPERGRRRSRGSWTRRRPRTRPSRRRSPRPTSSTSRAATRTSSRRSSRHAGMGRHRGRLARRRGRWPAPAPGRWPWPRRRGRRPGPSTAGSRARTGRHPARRRRVVGSATCAASGRSSRRAWGCSGWPSGPASSGGPGNRGGRRRGRGALAGTRGGEPRSWSGRARPCASGRRLMRSRPGLDPRPGRHVSSTTARSGRARAVLRVQRELRERLERQPVRFLDRELEAILARPANGSARSSARDPADLAFVPNATTGVNTVLGSLRFEPGDEMLTTDHEYNAMHQRHAARGRTRRGAGRGRAARPSRSPVADESSRPCSTAVTAAHAAVGDQPRHEPDRARPAGRAARPRARRRAASTRSSTARTRRA